MTLMVVDREVGFRVYSAYPSSEVLLQELEVVFDVEAGRWGKGQVGAGHTASERPGTCVGQVPHRNLGG